MKFKKNISDLIRDNQHKLDERPSPRAWRKLESRLENQNNRKKTYLYRQLAMVAAVVALVAVISLLTVLTQQNKQDFASIELNSENWIAQNLETISGEGNQNIRAKIQFQRKLKKRYPNSSIQEGIQTKKLLASQVSINNSKNIGDSDALIAINQKPSEFKTNQIEKELQSNYSDVVVVQDDVSTDQPSDMEVFSESDEEAIASNEKATSPREPIVSSSSKNFEASKREHASIPSKRASKAKKVSNIQLESFDWLVGIWKLDNNKYAWKKPHSNMLHCDQFEIIKLGEKLSLKDRSSGNKIYDLKVFENHKSVFQDKLGHQIIFQKISPTSFSITYVNSRDGNKEIQLYEKS